MSFGLFYISACYKKNELLAKFALCKKFCMVQRCDVLEERTGLTVRVEAKKILSEISLDFIVSKN